MDGDNGFRALSYLKKVCPQSLPPDAKAEYFFRLAHAYTLTGRYTLGKNAIRKAQTLYIKNRDEHGLKLSALRLGDIERQLENPLGAIQAYQKAAKGLDSLRQDAEMGIALSLRSLGRFKIARRKIEATYRRYRQNNDSIGSAHALWALATTDRFLGNFRQAEREARMSLSICMRRKDQGGTAFAWAALGGILRMRGNGRESCRAYQNAFRIFKSIGDDFGLAYACCGIGNSFRMQNKYLSALRWSHRAEGIYRQLKMRGPLAYVLWALAQSEIRLRRRKNARHHLNEAEKLFKKVRDLRGLVYVALGWGEFNLMFSKPAAFLIFRRAKLAAQKMAMRFEMAEAASRMSVTNNFEKFFKSCGVNWDRFRSYQTFP